MALSLTLILIFLELNILVDKKFKLCFKQKSGPTRLEKSYGFSVKKFCEFNGEARI